MKQIGKFIILAAVAALSVAASKPIRGNWTAAIVLAPSGSHILGNPGAKVKVAEYVSYTCPHCAALEMQSGAAIRLGYIQPGNVSLEVRHLVRDPIDLAVALLTNCGAPTKFFRNHANFMQSQANWIALAQGASAAQQARWSNGPLPARMRAIAADFHFYDRMESLGYSRADTDRCLANQAVVDRLMAMRKEAIDSGVQGTPSFKINSTLNEDAHDWRSLEAEIKKLL